MDPQAYTGSHLGAPIALYRLAHGALEAWISNLGAIVVGLHVPDAQGRCADIVLGCPDLATYLESHPYFGAICGRAANRIAYGRFQLDGCSYQLACNDGAHHLHGGPEGFHRRVFDVIAHQATGESPSLLLRLDSPDGDEAYPGALKITVRYSLTASALRIDVLGSCQAPTIVNLTHHGYFNLGGHEHPSILNHIVQSPASRFLATDASSIPLPGTACPVAHGPFDFRKPKALGADISQDHEQLRLAGGYDHHFVVEGEGFRWAARVQHVASGRSLELWTNAPGFQLYTGNRLDRSVRGKDGSRYGRHSGLCLEAQWPPNAVNRPDFPSPILRPGETYHYRCEYRFPHLRE